MTTSVETVKTILTQQLGIKYPIILAGMSKAAGPKLAAAVTNHGGLGVVGGVRHTPRVLKILLQTLKKDLIDPNAPYGVDLLIPKIGGGARKTNYDYTKGKLDELIDVIIDAKGCKLFVSAVGVPPKYIVDRLHKNGILVMNMVGHPKHVNKALKVGVDIICAQGAEAGGHTGTTPTSILLPACVDLCKDKRMTLYPQYNVPVVGAGGIYDGRGLAMALSYGCQAVWIGTRFVATHEAGATLGHKKAICAATYEDAQTTLVYSGRPLRTLKNEYTTDWETNRVGELRKLLKKGVVPRDVDGGFPERQLFGYQLGDRYIAGEVAGNIYEIKYAKDVMNDIMSECVACLKRERKRIVRISSKL